MDAIQEFGYICAVEELNKAIESFEPATESAIDAIKNIAKKFWNFVMMVCRKIITSIQSAVRKLRSSRRLAVEDRFKLDELILKQVPALVKVCDEVEAIMQKRGNSAGRFNSDLIEECAKDVRDKMNDATNIRHRIDEIIKKDNVEPDLKEDHKTNIEDFAKPLEKHVEHFKKLENNARQCATLVGNFDPQDYEDDAQRQLARLYNNAQSAYNSAVTGISAVIAFISKL